MQESPTNGVRDIPPVEVPHELAVTVPSSQDSSEVCGILVAAGFATEEGVGGIPVLIDSSGKGFEALGEWLEQHPSGHLLMLFSAPVPAIARTMADAVEPGEALALWRQDAERLLHLLRTNRHRLTLIALEPALAAPGVLVDLLARRFGLALEQPLAKENAGKSLGAVFRMIAANALWQSPDACNIADELEANALPMPVDQGVLLPTVDEVFREFNLLTKAIRVNEGGNKLDELHEGSERQIKELKEENELLIQQLHHLQEELESYYLNGIDTPYELEQARAKIESLYNSKSWRITKPLRFFLGLFTNDRKSTR